jgi:hypothetical protein
VCLFCHVVNVNFFQSFISLLNYYVFFSFFFFFFAQGKDSFFHPYLNLLPSTFDVPMYWQYDDIALLSQSSPEVFRKVGGYPLIFFFVSLSFCHVFFFSLFPSPHTHTSTQNRLYNKCEYIFMYMCMHVNIY